jgi:hypothetical protein
LIHPTEGTLTSTATNISVSDAVAGSLPDIPRANTVGAALCRIAHAATTLANPLIHSVANATSSGATLSDTLSGAWSEPVRRASTALSELPAGPTLSETLLGLSDRGPRSNTIASLKAIGDIPIAVRYAASMSRVMRPPVAISDVVDSVETVVVDEVIVDEDVTPAPARIPSPSAPSATTPDRAQRETRAE